MSLFLRLVTAMKVLSRSESAMERVYFYHQIRALARGYVQFVPDCYAAKQRKIVMPIRSNDAAETISTVAHAATLYKAPLT